MTQKELSYLEDAINHEISIIAICQDMTKRLSSQDLISFIEEEITKHQDNKTKLMNLMEDKSNDW